MKDPKKLKLTKNVQRVKTSFPLKKTLSYLALLLFVPILLELMIPQTGFVRNKLISKGVSTFLAIRDAVSAPKPITIKLTYNNEGLYDDLSNKVNMGDYFKRRELKSELNGFEWILANAGDGYLDHIHSIDHFAKDFAVVPYDNFGSSGISTPSNQARFIDNNLKVGAIVRKFTDGKIRKIYLDETFYAFQPNTHRQWRTNTFLDDHENIEPTQSLPRAAFKFTSLYNHEEGFWYKEEVFKWVQFQLAFSYGCMMGDPELFEITGDGLDSKFVYRGKLGVSYINNAELVDRNVDMVYILRMQPEKRLNGKIVPKRMLHVPSYLKSKNDEICFYGSADPKQSIIIPRSLIKEIKDDDPMRIYDFRGKKFEITFNDIKAEHQHIRDNMGKSMITKGNYAREYQFTSDTSHFIVKNKNVTKIANFICEGSADKQEAIQRLVDMVQVPYYSDVKKSIMKKGYTGPRDVPLPVFTFMLNGGGDCEDHANAFVSLFISADNKILRNEYAATGLLDYHKSDKERALHIIPLIAVDHWKAITFPFNNHFIDPTDITGQRKLFFVEVTGKDPKLGTCMPNITGYETVGIKPIGSKKWYDLGDLKCQIPSKTTGT